MMVMDVKEDLDENYVYEQLSGIRSAFETLIDRYGYSAIEDTMNQVVAVLEQFEGLVAYKRQSQLRLANADLILEEVKETHALQDLKNSKRLTHLQADNGMLRDEIASLKDQLENNSHREEPPVVVTPHSDPTSEVLTKLNDVISAQTGKLNEITEEYEELSAHSTRQSALILKLKAGLQESVYSHKVLQARNDTLCKELGAAEAQIASIQLSTSPRPRFNSHSDERDSFLSSESARGTETPESGIGLDKDEEKAKQEYKRSAAQVIRDALSSYSPKLRRKQNKCNCEENGFKFSVEEMTLLINERNIAKEKLVTLEEELNYFKDREGIDFMTEEGFAILDPPRRFSPSENKTDSSGTMTRTLFQRVSRSEET